MPCKSLIYFNQKLGVMKYQVISITEDNCNSIIHFSDKHIWPVVSRWRSKWPTVITPKYDRNDKTTILTGMKLKVKHTIIYRIMGILLKPHSAFQRSFCARLGLLQHFFLELWFCLVKLTFSKKKINFCILYRPSDPKVSHRCQLDFRIHLI